MTDDDIVERLRATVDSLESTHFYAHHADRVRDGIAEIERLRADLERTRQAWKRTRQAWVDDVNVMTR